MSTTLRSLFRLVALFGLFLLLHAPALAQQSQFLCQDETDQLNCSQIAAAAQPLRARGAEVVVYMVRRGDSSGDDFLARLREANLASGDSVDAELVAIYVSLDPRYAELRGGDRWNAALLANDTITTIRTTTLVPALAAGEYTNGFVDTLAAIDAAIANPQESGAPGQPTTVINVGNFNTTPLAWSLLGVTVLVGGGYGAFRWRRARHALAEARWFYTEAKQAAGSAIVELDRALQADRDQAAYDAVSYGPEDVAQLAATQRAINEQFTQAQARFEATDEQFLRHAKPSVVSYTAATDGYKQVKLQLDPLQQQLATHKENRQALDQLAQQASAIVEQTKAHFANAAHVLDPLSAALANRDNVLAPLRDQIAQAEAALAAHDARRAIEVAQATGSVVANLTATVENYSQYQAQITERRDEATVLERQGYRIATCHAALDQAQRALEAGAAGLELGSTTTESFADVALALEQAAAQGRGMLVLRAENDQRLLAIGVRAQQVAVLLNDARRKFDLVDEFAPTTWSDIHGNGSQAEALAAEAAALWQQAASENTIEQQAFEVARDHLHRVETNLTGAVNLCEAIVKRLHDLEHARTIAQDELAWAAADIASGETYLNTHDADVGQRPAEQFHKAAGLLAEAQSEAVKSKPDWLALVRLAQAANAEADAALVNARTEAEAMAKLRVQVEHAQQMTAAEVERAERFYTTHRGDLGWSTHGSFQSLRDQLYAANNVLRQAEHLAEGERRAALEQAHKQFMHTDKQADEVYAEMYREYERVEAARIAEAEAERRRSSSSRSSSWSGSGSSSSSSSSGSGSRSGGSWGGGSSSSSSWGGGSRSGGGW